jgi:hypothetical protein
MITVKVNGKFIDLDPEIKIQMKVENPLFSASFINEGYSYSFSLPRTEKNKLLLKKQEATFDVFVKGIWMFRSYIVSFSDNSDTIDVNVITEGKYFRKKCEEIKFAELDLQVVQICDETDVPAIKISKWEAYMQSTLSIPKLEQTHVFPHITSPFGYDLEEDVEPGEYNSVFEWGEKLLNRNIFGEYKLGYQTPLALGNKQWITSVAPCLKANYLLNKILDKFGLKVRVNELKNIPEFVDLFIFNNYVLDKLEEFGPTTQYNVHGTEINEQNHVTNTNLYSLLQLLNEVFDAYFVIEKTQIDILISKNRIKSKPNNETKFFSDIYNKDKSIVISGSNFSYEIDDTLNIYYRTFDMDGDPNVSGNFIYPYNTRNYPNSKLTNSENQLTATPINTFCFGAFNGMPRTNAEYIDQIGNTAELWKNYAYGQIFSRANSPFRYKSDLYENDAEIFDKIYFGCFRGIYDSVQPFFNETTGIYEPAGNVTFDHPFTYSFKVGGFLGQTVSTEIDIKHVFGFSSVYINEDDNCFDYYKKDKLALLYNSENNTKLAQFPFFKLLKLLKWDDIKHVIQQKNESFQGFAKSYSFTLSNQGISATEVEYVVRNKDLKGEFNDDFGNDYNIE